MRNYSDHGTKMLITIAFRNIWRSKRRSAFCISAIGITVFVFLLSTSFNDGMFRCINDTVQVFQDGHVRIVSSQYEAEKELLPVQYPVADGRSWRKLAASIREIPGVRTVFPRISSRATLQESTIKHAVLWGLDIQGEMEANHFNIADRSDGLREGRWPAPGTNECAVGIIFARKSGLGIGDPIPLRTLSAQFSDRFWEPVITGIYSFDYFMFDERYIVVDIERLQRLLSLEEGTQSLVVFADNESQSSSIAIAVQNLLGQGIVANDWNENFFVASARAEMPIYVIAYLILLIVASFLIINTIAMIIHERIKEIGMMGCLGMTRTEILKVFFLESVFMAAIAASAAAIIGGILTGILSHFPIRIGDIYGNTFADAPISNTLFFQFSTGRIIQAWSLGVIIASLCTLIPSLKSTRIDPVEALRR